jgi:predicted ribosome quality control (RQC) complex YloA/Tae2 family protein
MIRYLENINNIDIPILFITGQTKTENNQLIIDAYEEDLWFHLNDYPSAHIIAVVHDLTFTKKQLLHIMKRGACLLKSISRYKYQTNLSINCTRIKNVELTNVLGTVMMSTFKTIII